MIGVNLSVYASVWATAHSQSYGAALLISRPASR